LNNLARNDPAAHQSQCYIRRYEDDKKITLLRAVDLPMLDRPKVMEELRFMGITAGSLFPGLDGACEEMTEQNFF
jgi:hypothetical protein